MDCEPYSLFSVAEMIVKTSQSAQKGHLASPMSRRLEDHLLAKVPIVLSCLEPQSSTPCEMVLKVPKHFKMQQFSGCGGLKERWAFGYTREGHRWIRRRNLGNVQGTCVHQTNPALPECFPFVEET